MQTKRFFAFIFILSLLLLSFPGYSETVNIEETENADSIEVPAPLEDARPAIVYFAAIKDESTIKAARIACDMIVSGLSDVELYRDDSTSSFSDPDEVFTGKNTNNNEVRVLSAEENSFFNTVQQRSGTAPVWMILPAKTKFTENGEKWFDQINTLLTNPTVDKLHLIVVGNKEDVAPELGDYIQSLSQNEQFDVRYLSTKLDEYTAQNGITPLFWFWANQFGQPMDLPVEINEQGQKQFELPEDGTVFITAFRYQSQEPLTVYLSEATENDAPAEELTEVVGVEQKSVTTLEAFAGSSRSDVNYVGLYMRPRKGRYTISEGEVATTQLRVYYYPDLEKIAPLLEAGDAVWMKNNALPIHISLGNDYGRKDKFSYILNLSTLSKDQLQPSEQTLKLNAEDNYTYYLDTTQVVSATVGASVELTDVDGNIVYSKQLGVTNHTVQEADIEVTAEEINRIVYYDSATDQQGSVQLKWSDLFNYNRFDDVTFQIDGQEITDSDEQREFQLSGGIFFQKNDDGFVIRVTKEAAEKESVFPVCASNHTKTNTAQLHIVPRDFSNIISNVGFTVCSDQNPDSSNEQNVFVNAGSRVYVSVILTADTVNEWADALQNASFPIPQRNQLRLNVTCDNSDATDALPEPIPFVLDETGKMSAQWEYLLDENAQDGASFGVHLSVSCDNRQAAEANYTINAVNTSPSMIGTVPEKQPITVELNGWPGSYEPSRSLLEYVFGTEQLSALFHDDEKSDLTYTISVSRPELLQIAYDGDENLQPLTSDSLTIDENHTIKLVITDRGDPLKENDLNQKNTEQLILTASDGVNASNKTVITFRIISSKLKALFFMVVALLGLLVLFIICMLIRQARKPSFAKDGTVIKCVSTTTGADLVKAMEFASPIPLQFFKKKGLTLLELLIIAKQPPLSDAAAKTAAGIEILPGRNMSIRMKGSSAALKEMGMTARDCKMSHPEEEVWTIHFNDVTISLMNCGHQED